MERRRDIRFKICGLTRPEDVAASAEAGAAYVGFVFFARSPRHLGLAAARDLAVQTPAGIAKVGLVVNAGDAELDALLEAVPLDMLQLHGSETPGRVAEIRARTGLPAMKAIGVATAADLRAADAHAAVADQLLIDAKPPEGAAVPGGNGLRFDWRLLSGRRWPRPWMLAGGLTSENAAEAVALTGARQLDVSSGVEAAPGIKDPARIAAFARALWQAAAPPVL